MAETEVVRLLKQYRDTINQLRALKVIGTAKVVSDYGEFVACQKLSLKMADNSVNKGFDALDDEGKKYEIKTRKATAWRRPTKFVVTEEQLKTADYLVYVEFDDDWNLVRLLKIPTEQVMVDGRNRVLVTKELIQNFKVF